MKADAVFQGGGIKVIGLAGAVKRFEEYGFTWERLAGTSSGAIMASLLAVGYSGKEISKIISDMNFAALLKRNVAQAIPLLGKPVGVIFDKGMYMGDNIEKWLDGLYAAKGKSKFKDVSVNGKSRLKIIASDITRQKTMILPDDLINYGIDPLSFKISRAVLMSISIPLFFNPVILEHKYGISYIVDGGVFSNFPIWIFDVKGIPRWPTFGFKYDREDDKKGEKKSFIGYIGALVDSLIENVDETILVDSNLVRTVTISALSVKSTDFHISKKRAQNLYKSGYDNANEFLMSWNFKEYIRKYRMNI